MVTVEVDMISKPIPIFVAMLKMGAVSGLAAVKEALALRNGSNLHQTTGKDHQDAIVLDLSCKLGSNWARTS